MVYKQSAFTIKWELRLSASTWRIQHLLKQTGHVKIINVMGSTYLTDEQIKKYELG